MVVGIFSSIAAYATESSSLPTGELPIHAPIIEAEEIKEQIKNLG